MNPSTKANEFTVGYLTWVMWLMILGDLIFLTPLLGAIAYMLSPDARAHPSYDPEFVTWAVVILGTMSFFMLSHLYTIVAELRRKGDAIRINPLGIHLWRASTETTPWSDIREIKVFDINRGSRFILLRLENTCSHYPSPYFVINMVRAISLRRFRRTMKMYLDGVACDNQALRTEISKYSDKLAS